MSARVMLFADFGKGPRALRLKVQRERWRSGCIGYGYRGHRICKSPSYFVSRVALNMIEGACRWWLVECESAEAGRAIIAEGASGEVTIRLGTGLAKGRILDGGTHKVQP